ncbi:hypothetical protein NE237_019303 [Protea cynaroides]|uniref:NB-ARC domain-containing protein n=1 Tax=Protea cynaroides TaxID=273540 RepID=A0A9Q0QPZ2_9MAGN|nr:hypothetical protein NE237_019303 [Protea cynaroides]
MTDIEISSFINRMGHTLLAEVDSLHEVEDKLWSLLCLLMRLRSFLMEVERKQSEELKKFVMEVVTLVHEAEKVTVSYLNITRKSGLVMDEAHKFKSKIMGFRSKMMESHARFHKFSESSTSNTSSLSKQRPPPSTEDGDTVVVLEDEVKRMINLLTDEDQDGQRGIIPIVGPGGMGKTFFVRTIYNDSTIVEHFPCRLWINVSSNHKIEELLQDIIEQIKPATTATTATSDNTEDADRRKEMKNLKDLAIETYKLLKNSTRYLVVFDNVCKAQFWANINPVFLANNKHGSRIIVITRHVEVVSHLRSSRPSFYLRRLSKEEGRTLFSKRVNSLVDSHSHTQLDPNHYHTYHELVDACGGLPLAIVALATEYHRRLLSATDNEKDEESGSDKRLSLEICECIYNGLPHHLKMCLTYYHVLEEGYHFFDYKGLIIAEGLVKLQPPRVLKIQSRDQASSSAASTAVVAAEIEDTAEEYLNELINMNLIKVQRRTSDGRIKEITIPREYYSLSDLCRSKVACCKMKKLEVPSLFINYQSRSEIEKKMLSDVKLIYEDAPPCRVLDLMHVDFDVNPCIINLIHLRYLRLEIDFYPHHFTLNCLSNLWNLQYVKVKLMKFDYNIFLEDRRNLRMIQFQFWKMQQLRHFLLRGSPEFLINPSFIIVEKEVNSSDWRKISLKNLLTLEGLDPQYCTEDVLSMMPNLLTLCLNGETSKFDDRLARVFPLLERLQKLRMESTQILKEFGWSKYPSSKLEIFPPNITHLTLIWTRIEAEYLERALLKLQNLRILKLDKQSIHFADNVLVGAMPSLQKLTVISCKSLKGLPSEALEAIPTLQELELRGLLKDKVLSDARLIKEHVGKDRLKLSTS